MTHLIPLNNDDEWEKFKADFMLQNGIEEDLVTWGDTAVPSSFPCLVSGTVVDTSIVCVFVYLDDAKQLLISAGYAVKSRKVTFMDKSGEEVSGDSVWNRHMVAFFLAMLHELISVGITKEERFEPLVTRMLTLVDNKHATDLGKVKELIDREFRRETG